MLYVIPFAGLFAGFVVTTQIPLPFLMALPDIYNIKEYSIKDTICRHLSMINNNDSRELWPFTWCTQIRDHGNHNISVGYYLDKNGGIDTDVRNQIYCFFPTSEKIELCCIMHAPFLLTDNRTNMSSKYNQERRNLAKIQKDLDECIEYHDRLHVIADQQISFDLDDGVIVNYAKFGDVLAKIK